MHPRLQMTWKRALKIERVARLSLDPAMYSNEQIANHLKCHVQTVVLIRQLPEYHAKMLELSSGILSAYDADLRSDTDNARAELKSMIPSSMMVIRDALLNKRNPALQFKAALEIMDREGSMAKVSKSSVAVEVKPNMQVDPNVASNLMALLSSAPNISNSSDLINGMGGSFTKTAAQAGQQQIDMALDNTERTLENLDLSDKKPN